MEISDDVADSASCGSYHDDYANSISEREQPTDRREGRNALPIAIAVALAFALGFAWVRRGGAAPARPLSKAEEEALPTTTSILDAQLHAMIASGSVPADAPAVLHGHTNVVVVVGGVGGAVDRSGVRLFRGLLGPEPTRRWQNDSHIVAALRRGCFHAAPWPLSTSNQICVPAAAAADLVARSRRRTAFWPGDEEYRYIFHGVRSQDSANPSLRDMVFADMPLDVLSSTFHVDLRGPLRRNDFFLGARGTGTALHVHSAAINALAAGGPKIWVTAPGSSMAELARFQYGRVTQRSVDDWLLSNLDVLTDVPGLAIFVQRAGDVVALPHFTFHATVNLQYNVGTAFSWPCDDGGGGGSCAADGADVLRAQGAAMKECLQAHACKYFTEVRVPNILGRGQQGGKEG